MSRRKRGRPVHGVVLLDKPAGLSSNQALQRLRRAYDARKAGHTGNLDPFATGMLPVCLGEATKTAAFMIDASKAYRAVALLGESTSTGDPEGEVIQSMNVPGLTDAQISTGMECFIGEIEQVPPMYSALKHEGKRLYELARQGVEVERKPRKVTVHAISLVAWNPPHLEFEVHCSKGTYIRTLAQDLAVRLGTCAHLVALRRLYVEPFKDLQMVGLDVIEAQTGSDTLEQFLLPVDAGIEGWDVVELQAPDARAFSNGNPVGCAMAEPGMVRVRGPHGLLLGLAERDAGGRLRPRRVMCWEDQEPGLGDGPN